jgi:hypothetical protein
MDTNTWNHSVPARVINVQWHAMIDHNSKLMVSMHAVSPVLRHIGDSFEVRIIRFLLSI